MAKPVVVRIVGEANFDKAAESVGKFGKAAAVGIAAVGAASAAAAVGAFKLGQSFDEAERSIAVATGATGEQLEKLNADFDAIASSVPDSFGVVAGAVGDINTLLGITGEVASDLGVQLLDAGRLLEEDGNSIVNSFGKMAKQIGLADDELGPFADGLFKLTQDTGIGFAKLTDQVAQLRPTFQFAFNDQEIAGFVAQLDSVGLTASQIQGPFARFLKEAASAGREPRDAFGELVEQIKSAGSEADALNLGFEAFGSRGGASIVAAIRNGTVAFDDLAGAFEGTDGLIADTNERLQTLGERWAEFRNNLAIRIRPVATFAFDGVERALTGVLGLLDRVGAAFRAAFERTNFLDRFGPAIGRIGAALGELGGKIAEAFGAFGGDGGGSPLDGFLDLLVAGAEAVARFVESLSENESTISGFVGVITGLGATIATFIDFASAIWSRWGEEITEVVVTTFRTISGVVEGALGIIQGLFQIVSGVIQGDWGLLWEGLGNVVGGAVKIIGSLISGLWNLLGSLFTAGGKLIAAVFGGLWDGLKALVRTGVDGIVNFAKSGFDRLLDAFRGLPGRVARAVAGLFDPIFDQFKGVLDRVRGLWDGLDFSIPKIDLPGPLPTIGGGRVRLPGISALTGLIPAASGFVSTGPTALLTGEYLGARSNPEITSPQSLMADTFRAVLNERGGGQGGPSIVIERIEVDRGRDVLAEINATAGLYGLGIAR